MLYICEGIISLGGYRMENVERDKIQRLLSVNFALRKLYTQHRLFERRLSKLGKLNYLTTQEELEQKKLKQLKLRGVDQMIRMVAS